jgi:hypothetical protein
MSRAISTGFIVFVVFLTFSLLARPNIKTEIHLNDNGCAKTLADTSLLSANSVNSDPTDQLIPSTATNKAYIISSTSTDNPGLATTEFTATQYTNIGSSNSVYVTSTAQDSITQSCSLATGSKNCDVCDNGCAYLSGCSAPNPHCTALSHATSSDTCSYGQNACSVSHCAHNSVCTGFTCDVPSGGCTYLCANTYYDTNLVASDGCESQVYSDMYGFQRYTFNLSAYSSITQLQFCWQGYYTATGGQNYSNLEWYNVTSASWTSWKQLPYNSANTFCINFSGSNLTDVQNSTGTWSQFAVRTNESRQGNLSTDYADFAYLNVTYTTPYYPFLNVTWNSPQNNTWNTSQTILHLYTPIWNYTTMANCSLWTNASGTFTYSSAVNTTVTNNTINSISYNYGSDYTWLGAYINCTNTTGTSNTTGNYIIKIDTIPPTYSQNSTNSTWAGKPVNYSLYWQDSGSGLSGYNFSFDNCTGTFVNDSWVAMTGSTNWSNVTKTINSTVGCLIRWCVYTNDTANNWNSTSCNIPFNYTTTLMPVPSLTTDATNYSSCGAVFYRVSLYDANFQPISSSFSLTFLYPNSTTASSSASLYPNNGTGIYTGSYILNATYPVGTWLLKVIEIFGATAGKNFNVAPSS